jgi:hypothetical protein
VPQFKHVNKTSSGATQYAEAFTNTGKKPVTVTVSADPGPGGYGPVKVAIGPGDNTRTDFWQLVVASGMPQPIEVELGAGEGLYYLGDFSTNLLVQD